MRYKSLNYSFADWLNNYCNSLILKTYCPLGSAVEHSLHTRGVSSSNLLAGTRFKCSGRRCVARSIFRKPLSRLSAGLFSCAFDCATKR